ncbi:host attachment protein [Roseitalea porphyridii]|uniref:Host attachment protein n=1 Tax=Roseitalea porphyridii TaxID=1852022 RepID=A0A4P6V1Q4_9HYPH|nr:host attachment family protein [Roseitalea porphyridii]QBK31291.1 host attachment protein [Roseitalea porphyridii]
MSEHEIRLKHDGWIVVADGEKALFLRNEGDEKFPNLEVFREDEQRNPPTREQGTDTPGRFNDGAPSSRAMPAGSAGAHRSAVQETDWHRLEKDRFARQVAECLYKYAHAGRFEHLVIAAAPHVLGEIRKELHKEVADRVIAEVDKDLTNHEVDKIEKLLLHSDGKQAGSHR